MGNLIDLTARQFGRWTVQRHAGFTNAGSATWLCVCTCGTTRAVDGQQLRSGKSCSCGCLVRERMTTHGMYDQPEYHVWQAMIQRCQNRNSPAWKNYGARGITVCARWQTFESFFADMGRRPSPDLSLERVNNNGGYWCGHCSDCVSRQQILNCKWETAKRQCRNFRRNRIVTYRGQSESIADWADKIGMKYSTLNNRIWAGWTIEDAFNQPLRGNYRKTNERNAITEEA